MSESVATFTKEELIKISKEFTERKFESLLNVEKVNLKGSCYTLTLGDVAENHAGMQMIGAPTSKGLELKDLKKIAKEFPDTEIVALHDLLKGEKLPKGVAVEEAYLLIIRGGLKSIGVDANAIAKELSEFDWDTEAIMRGRLVKKRARWNVCFDKKAQKPNIEEGKGRIIPFSQVPNVSEFKDFFSKLIEVPLVVEGNWYYDVAKCGIGYHGDGERRIVIATRIGETIPLYYRWYHKSERVGKPWKGEINHGDIYVMSSKAVGFDWKKRSQLTLRHAAGCDKYVK